MIRGFKVLLATAAMGLAITGLVIGAAGLSNPSPPSDRATEFAVPEPTARQQQAVADSAKLPVSFAENRGQTDSRAALLPLDCLKRSGSGGGSADEITMDVRALVALGALALVWALPTAATAADSIAPREPRILSASWGTDNAVGCPTGEQGLDNIPVTFSWFIVRSSIQTTDFQVVRSDGSSATPTCALQFPPDESDEGQTVNLIGDFGDSVNGPTPVAIRVVGALQGTPPGTIRWRQIAPLPAADVEPLPDGPNIVDAWTLTPAIYRR